MTGGSLTPEARKEKGAYLRSHKIPQLVDELVASLTDHMPEEPVTFIQDWAHNKASNQMNVVSIGRRVSLSLAATTDSRPASPDDRQLRPRSSSCLKKSPDATPTMESIPATPVDSKNKVVLANAASDPGKSPEDAKNKAQLRAQRREFFGTYAASCETETKKGDRFKCVHLGCLTLALSYLLGGKKTEDLKKRVTLEDIFFKLKLPLHYLNNPGMTLSELYDIAREFVREDPRFNDIKLVKINFDTRLYDADVTPQTSMLEGGERGPVISLAQLRDQLTKETTSMSCIRIMQFDPFIVEQGQKRLDEDDEDEDEEGDGEAQPVDESTIQDNENLLKKRQLWSRYRSRGVYSVVQEYNPVKHEALLQDVILGDGVSVTPRPVPIQLLYKSMSLPDGYSQRPRGFLELDLALHQEQHEHSIQVSSVFHSRLLTGTGEKGTRLANVHPNVSPHLTAVAFGLHLLHGQDESGYGQLGVDVGTLVRTLNLPMSIVCDNQMHIQQVHDYTQKYLELSGMRDHVTCSLVSMEVSNPWDTDAAPPVSVTSFESLVINNVEKNTNPIKPTSVMVVNFDVNAAHNVMGLERGACRSHYAIVVGYNKEHSLVNLADVSPKKFKKYWKTPLFRLHSAMVGKGMLFFSHREGATGLKRSSSRPRSVYLSQSLVQPTEYDQSFVPSFEFPPRVFSVTPLALALHRLGYPTSPGAIATQSSYDMNFLLSNKLSMFDLQRVGRTYVSNCLEDGVTLEAYPFDDPQLQEAVSSEDGFSEYLKKVWAEDEKKEVVTLLFYNAQMLLQNMEAWGGDIGLLTKYDADKRLVTVCDVNPMPFYRSWTASATTLLPAMLDIDQESRRPRGVVRIYKKKAEARVGRPLSFLKMKSHHPLKMPPFPQFTCLAFSLSQLGIPCSAENIFYSGYKALVTEEKDDTVDELFPWKQTTFKLSQLKRVITLPQCASVAMRYLEKSKVTDVKVEPVAVPADMSLLKGILAEGAKEDAGVVSLTYRPPIIHPGVEGKVGVAVVHGVTDDMVHCIDINPTKYGTYWVRSVKDIAESIKEAGSEVEKGHYGLLRYTRCGSSS